MMKAADTAQLSMDMVDMGHLSINIDGSKCEITRGLSFWEVDDTPDEVTEDENENKD